MWFHHSEIVTSGNKIEYMYGTSYVHKYAQVSCKTSYSTDTVRYNCNIIRLWNIVLKLAKSIQIVCISEVPLNSQYYRTLRYDRWQTFMTWKLHQKCIRISCRFTKGLSLHLLVVPYYVEVMDGKNTCFVHFIRRVFISKFIYLCGHLVCLLRYFFRSELIYRLFLLISLRAKNTQVWYLE